MCLAFVLFGSVVWYLRKKSDFSSHLSTKYSHSGRGLKAILNEWDETHNSGCENDFDVSYLTLTSIQKWSKYLENKSSKILIAFTKKNEANLRENRTVQARELVDDSCWPGQQGEKPLHWHSAMWVYLLRRKLAS